MKTKRTKVTVEYGGLVNKQILIQEREITRHDHSWNWWSASDWGGVWCYDHEKGIPLPKNWTIV